MSGNETILLVEDEPMLQQITSMALASKGYRVLHAKDGLEALEVYEKHRREIRLVVTDMDLPKLSGEELVRRMREMNSSVEIIVTSGYLEPEVKERVLQSDARAFLAKPYEHPQLLALVRKVLDAKQRH